MINVENIKKLINLSDKFSKTGKIKYWEELVNLNIDWMRRESTGEVFIKAVDFLEFAQKDLPVPNKKVKEK